MTAIAEISDRMQMNGRPPARSRAEYRRAARHSHLVRALKFTLPLIAVVVTAGFFWASLFTSTLPDNLQIDRSVLQNGKLVMSDPVLTGQDTNGALYKITARRAVQDLSQPDRITLETIHATLPLKSGEFATIDAQSAYFDRKSKIVTFDKPFRIRTTGGMSGKIETARFDVKAGQFISETPVVVDSNEGSIVARSMRMGDKGHTIEFNDRVKMTVNPSPTKAPVAEGTK